MIRTTIVKFLLVAVLASAAQAVTIETVPVGNLGNANDPLTGNLYGGVGYAYRIATKEVTVAQYVEFLNAVARTDAYELYNPTMSNNPASIARSGLPGSFSYSVVGGSPHRPVNLVSWADAVRFANWMHNGQPNTGVQDSSTTERGAYTLDGAIFNEDLVAVTRNPGAKWFLPTENEWYKAAYHQPAAQGGDSDDYWSYAMRTNLPPISDQPPGTSSPDNTRVANFFHNDGVANGYNDGFALSGSPTWIQTQNYLTDVGAYSSTYSYYGTFDQGGNLFEWTETLFNSSAYVHRDTEWGNTLDTMDSSFRRASTPGTAGSFGIRLAAIPEPGTMALGGLGLAGLLLTAWRRRTLDRLPGERRTGPRH